MPDLRDDLPRPSGRSDEGQVVGEESRQVPSCTRTCAVVGLAVVTESTHRAPDRCAVPATAGRGPMPRARARQRPTTLGRRDLGNEHRHTYPVLDSTKIREQREATVREHMEAENAHDFDRCIAAFAHPRYEIVATGEVWDGHSGVNALLQENKKGFPDFQFHPESFHHASDAVIVEGRFTGTHRGNWRGLPPTGRKVDFRLIIVFIFEVDRMTCERTYFDIGTPLTQLGVARDPNSRAGKIAAALNHPVVIGKAVIRSILRR